MSEADHMTSALMYLYWERLINTCYLSIFTVKRVPSRPQEITCKLLRSSILGADYHKNNVR